MQIAKRKFRRESPVTFFDRGGVPMGWIVVRHDHVGTILERRRTHGSWVCIRSDKAKIFRVLRYSVNLPADEIVMDWAGWIDLQGRTDRESKELSLTITTAHLWQFVTIPFRHVDPAYRLSAWLAGISLLLGVVSLIASRPWDLVWPQRPLPPIATHVSIRVDATENQSNENMTKAEAKPKVIALFRQWASENGKTLPYGSPEGGFLFYHWLQQNHPDALNFRASGDKWQVIHGWLLASHLVRH